MTSEGRAAILADMKSRRISAIIRTDDQSLARDAMNAAVAGGFRMVEFTLTTPGALELVAEFAARGDLLVGAGTVLEVEQARQAVKAGASFLVSPIFDAAIVGEAARQDVVSVPGTYSPTEMNRAVRAGADVLKLFPAPGPVADYVRAILGPFPDFRIFPTAGVNADNMIEVLEAGAFGVGFVRSLFASDDLSNRNLSGIESRARDIVSKLRSISS